MVFVCERCHYTTKLKADYKKHLTRKIKCADIFSSKEPSDIINDLINNDCKEYKCDNCSKYFKSASSRANHKRVCEKERERKQLEDLLKQFNEKLDLFDKRFQTTQVNETHDTTNTVNLYIGTNPFINNIGVSGPRLNKVELREFGHENMDALPQTFIGECFMNLKFRDIIENLHCDPDFPENHNIRLKSIKRNVMEIFRDNKWVAVSLAYGIEELINKTTTIFENYAKKNEKRIYNEDMSEEEFESNMDTLLKISNMDKKAIQPVFKDIQLLLESYKDGIIRSHH